MGVVRGFLIFFGCLQFGIPIVNAASFSDLTPVDQARVISSDLVVLPVYLENNLLKGDVFKYVPLVASVIFASVFFDYDEQYRFLPGMTSTQVMEWSGTRALVRQRINPIGFISDQQPESFQNWFFDLGAYSYDLDEVVVREGEIYTIAWSIPPERRVLNSEEKGQIRMEPFGTGTLISYQNATEPFLYETLFRSSEPDPIAQGIQELLCQSAQSYYERTVYFFVKRTQELIEKSEIGPKVQHLLAVLDGDKAQ